jgi:hypothetical protein
LFNHKSIFIETITVSNVIQSITQSLLGTLTDDEQRGREEEVVNLLRLEKLEKPFLVGAGEHSQQNWIHTV